MYEVPAYTQPFTLYLLAEVRSERFDLGLLIILIMVCVMSTLCFLTVFHSTAKSATFIFFRALV